jgi:hypothetical protein
MAKIFHLNNRELSNKPLKGQPTEKPNKLSSSSKEPLTKSNNKLPDPLAPSTSAELLHYNWPLISVLQGSQTQSAIGVLPVATPLLATPSAQLHLKDYVAPKSSNMMLTSFYRMTQLNMELVYSPAQGLTPLVISRCKTQKCC